MRDWHGAGTRGRGAGARSRPAAGAWRARRRHVRRRGRDPRFGVARARAAARRAQQPAGAGARRDRGADARGRVRVRHAGPVLHHPRRALRAAAEGQREVAGPGHRARHVAHRRDGVRRADGAGRGQQPAQGHRAGHPPRVAPHPGGADRRRRGRWPIRCAGRRPCWRRWTCGWRPRGWGSRTAAAPIDIVDEPIVELRDGTPPAARAGAPRRRATSSPTTSRWAATQPPILVVSGPNAGGKTVLMKTVGLAALMARAGLLVAADPRSRVGFFDDVRADIGDRQSVVGDLSTFSGHLANVADILRPGTGPAPRAGAAGRAHGRHQPGSGRGAGARDGGGAGVAQRAGRHHHALRQPEGAGRERRAASRTPACNTTWLSCGRRSGW